MTPKKRHTPAAWVIEQFGGIRPLARTMGRNPAAVFRWKVNGYIPANLHRLVLEAAERKQLDVRPEDLVVGR